MSDKNGAVTLGPVEEAQRLWRGATEAAARARDDIASLSEALDLGLRAVEILAVHRLRPIKDAFPATIGLLLDAPDPEVEAYRDAIHIPPTLGFAEVLDLLSAEALDCVGPALHRGWEDRVFSCRRSRATAQEALGLSLEAGEREHLLLLAAYRNRIFRSPPPIEIRPKEILTALPVLTRLFEILAK